MCVQLSTYLSDTVCTLCIITRTIVWLYLWLFVWLFFIIKESCSSSHHLGERVVIFDCMVVSMVVFHDQRELFI